MNSDIRDHVVILVLIVVTYVIGVVAVVKLGEKPPKLPAVPLLTAGQIGGSWVVIGTGLAAAAIVHYAPSFLRNALRIREASESVGGRVLSTSMSVSLPSTISPPREFGAWVFKPFTHVGVRQLLQKLNMSVIPVELRTAYTFIYDKGSRRPFGELPSVDTLKQKSFAEVASADPVFWFAHTGAWVQSCPNAAAELIHHLDMPLYGNAVTGFGWQAAVLQCIGRTPVRYNYALDSIAVKGPGVELGYASGDKETVAGVVLTMSPVDIVHVKGLPPPFLKRVQSAFTDVSVGILYAVWPSETVWWQKAGFFFGAVATSLPIGRVFIVSDNELRMQMSGNEHVAYWTKKFVEEGPDAAQADIARQLSEAFGASVPVPASAVYKPWPRSVSLWNVGHESKDLQRPFGTDAPVFWASSDISDHPGWIGGAVHIGHQTVQEVETYILKKYNKK